MDYLLISGPRGWLPRTRGGGVGGEGLIYDGAVGACPRLGTRNGRCISNPTNSVRSLGRCCVLSLVTPSDFLRRLASFPPLRRVGEFSGPHKSSPKTWILNKGPQTDIFYPQKMPPIMGHPSGPHATFPGSSVVPKQDFFSGWGTPKVPS